MINAQELTEMKGTVIVKVPQLLADRKENATDLLYGARIAPATAYRLAEGKAKRISFDVLASLCNYFGVGIGQIIEYVPGEEIKK